MTLLLKFKLLLVIKAAYPTEAGKLFFELRWTFFLLNARRIPAVDSCLLVRKGVVVASPCPLDGHQSTDFHPPLCILISLEYPYPMICPFCYFQYVAICSLKDLVFSRKACWCQWLTKVPAWCQALQNHQPPREICLFLLFWVLIWDVSLCMPQVLMALLCQMNL